MPLRKSKKDEIKRDLKNIFNSLDYISQKLLNGRKFRKGEHQKFYNIYQQLGLAWEFLGLQCKHWDGFKKTRDRKKVCKICGKIKGMDDSFLLVPTKEMLRIGQKIKPLPTCVTKPKRSGHFQVPSTTGFTKVKITGDVVQSLPVTWSFDRKNVKKKS